MNFAEVEKFAKDVGFPIMLKAVNGGGGRGMRMAHCMSELKDAYERAKSEAKLAFGNDEIYLEKCIRNRSTSKSKSWAMNTGMSSTFMSGTAPSSAAIRKSSKSRRPLPFLRKLRQEICNAAVTLMKNVNYVNAGTVEFLVTLQDLPS